ncbi:MAG: hypothetical protein H7Y18_02790, partial [Clostridiaceae bacterium]|nr:hypothetical protein [Clostridiaceae bacterium]
MQKAKNADIVFTVGRADFTKINDFSNRIEAFKKVLQDKGINANVTTVSTSSITASDSFAWDTYDHYNFRQSYGPTLPNHITVSGKDIKMIGYTEVPYKDFLFVADDNKTQKTFSFDMQRDATDWHSMEGGGFLFNSSIKDGKIQGFCVLVTQQGIKLDKITNVNVNDFRNGKYEYVQYAGSLLKNYPINNAYNNHNFKIVVDPNTVSLWDNGVLIIDNFALPANDYGSGFGPITSHASHGCGQQSYFTFKNIVMQTVNGKSLAEVLNEQKWRSDAEKFVVNLSDDQVQDLKTSDMISKVSEIILQKGLYFGGLGTATNESQYKALINGIAGNGIYLNSTDFNLAMNNLENFMLSKILSKNYLINNYVNQGESVSYIDSYKDIENDPIMETKWKYVHDPNVFENNSGLIDSNDTYIDKPINIFDKIGAYGITLKARDNPFGVTDYLDAFRKWSDETELSKAIVVQRRPIAKLDVKLTLSADKTTCFATMEEDCYDLDHENTADKGIVSKQYKWKKVSDEGWTEGRLPSKLPVGQDYLAMMVVTDKEGTCSDSAVKLISTKALIQPTPVADTTKPTLTLALSKTEANIGDVVQVYVDAKDNVGIDKIEIYVDGKLASVALGARINFVANEVKTIPVEARVVDPSGNEARATAECKVVDNRDKVPPVVQITTPKPDSLIITPTQLIGTATDDIQLASYKLQYRLKGALDYITFAQATEAKSNGILGVFDPTTLANGDYEVRLTAEDVIGNSAYIENTYVVDRTKIPGADTEKPSIEITMSKTTANIGEEVQATVKATDNVKVDKLAVYVDGKLVMQDQGTVTFTSSSAKIMKVEVSAIDSSGNEARQINECQFIGTSDKIAPVVNIALPAANTAITKETEITGTAKDETQLERYRLQYRLKGAADYITFLESTTAKTDEVLGVFDPTLLNAGTYEVKLIAEDKGGNSVYIETTFVVPAPDTEKPLVSLVLSKATANVGDTVEATIKVTDNVKVSKVSVYLDGKLVMENQGTLTFTASEAKIMKLQVVASDTSGNEATQTAECSVIDTRDKIAPVVNITLPVIGRAITKPTAITGTAMDETKLERYRLQYRLQGTTDFTTFAEAQEPIIDGTLGTFDPTNLKNGIYEIRLIAEDKGGNNSYIQNIYLVEAAVNDTEKPTINLVVSKSVANLNDVVQVYTVAKDNVAVDKLELFIDGKLTELKGGIASFTASEVKTVSIKAVAVDTNGNQSEQTVECRVLDNRDAVPPTAEIKTPEADTHILAPTKIIGTAKDETKLYSYKLEYRLKDSKDFTLFKQSTDSKSNEELGVFDPTMLVNGIYEVRLSVEDMGGNILRTTTTYVVEGEMKIGHMSMGFEDINTSVSGMKMSVTRQYDNGNKQKGDFGIGWTLGLHNMKIYVSTPLGEGWEQVQQGTNLSTRYIIRETIPHYITVTYGDGKSDTFKASLSTQYQQYVPISQTKMNFQCTTNPRVKLELTGDNTVDILGGIGSIQLFSSDSLFDDYILNPQRFKLTNEEGTEVTIHVTNGIESIKDKNGNTMIIGKDGIKDSSGNGVIFTRDSQNRIITAKDPAGNITTYGYDAAGDLVSVKNPLGDVVGFKYDSKHNIIQITDPRGIAVARNEYDENGRLVATIDAAGNRMEYSHDVDGRQEVIKDRLGNSTFTNYDEKGNVLSQIDPMGNTTKYTYDARNNKLTETDAAGKTTTYTYDDRNNLTSITDATGNKTESTYDTQGRMLTETDPMGNVTSKKYNDAGYITEVKDQKGNISTFTYDNSGNILTITDAKGRLTKYTYDSNGNNLTETTPDGSTTTYTYDVNGNLKTSTATIKGKIDTVSFTYDSLNRLTKTTNADGTESTVVYNALGKKSVVTDTSGKVTQYEYDLAGNLSKSIYADRSVESFTYDSEGKKLSSTDIMGRTTTYAYDKAGRQTKTTFADGTSTENVYNSVGQEVKKIDENGNPTEYTYDAVGRNTQVKDALGNITAYEYDKNGKKIKLTDAKGNATLYNYDAKGMLTTVIFANGSKISYDYDVLGNKVSETNQEGKITRFDYDSNLKLKKVTDVLGNATEYSYNDFGSMAVQKDANGNETKFNYDSIGRRVKRTLQLGMSETFVYEKVGALKSHTSLKGDTTTFAYDDLGRLIQRTYADASTEKFTYYTDGQKKSAEDKRGITYYQYDSKG